MGVRNTPVFRTPQVAKQIQLRGMLRGAGLGTIAALPLTITAGILGVWLDGNDGKTESFGVVMLPAVTLMTGWLVGACWMGQREAMRDWPAACRQRVWGAWRLGLTICLAVGAPAAVTGAWLAWRDTANWSVALAGGLEVCWIAGLAGVAVGGSIGEWRARRYFQQAGGGSDGRPFDIPALRGADSSGLTVRDGVEEPPQTCRSENTSPASMESGRVNSEIKGATR